MNIVEVIDEVLSDHFPGDSWDAWRSCLKATFALEMDEVDLKIYRECTGREEPPKEPVEELAVIAGRRGGKSEAAALIAVYLACFKDYSPYLAAGERATLMCIAADRRQARTVKRYIEGLLSTPLLETLVESVKAEEIVFKKSVSIEIHTCSHRAVRGYTLVGVIADEIAFWRSEDSASPDKEVLAALRPAMATIPGSLLVAISSPYGRSGWLWEAWKEGYGKPSDSLLIWQAPTRRMNPTVPQSAIDKAYRADPDAARAEYSAEFRRDVAAYIAQEVLEACMVEGRHELPPLAGTVYHGFVDPSGGSQDSYTLAIAHREGEAAILDLVREIRPPFSPEDSTAELAATAKSYGLKEVSGDRYAGLWPAEQFQKHGVRYEASKVTKCDLYRELLPLLNSGRLELLENARLASQLLALERRTARGGRDSIDHPRGGHDDLANAVAGAAVLALAKPKTWGFDELFADQLDRDGNYICDDDEDARGGIVASTLSRW